MGYRWERASRVIGVRYLELHRLHWFTRYAKYVPLKPLLCFRLDPVDHASKQSEQSACIAETRLYSNFDTPLSQPHNGIRLSW